MRWTAKFKQQMLDNRIAVNSLLAQTLAGCQHKPQVLVCASGMGIYPPSGDQILTENSPLGSDFLAHLQCQGEAATAPASAAGIRLVHLRIPAVLGGPNLKRNMGRLGSGRQWSSWVSRDELACIIEYILQTETLVGPLNPTSPNPVRNAEFAATHSLVLGRKPGLPIPAFLLRLLAGEMANAIILPSRRMEPRKLLDSGLSIPFSQVGGCAAPRARGGSL